MRKIAIHFILAFIVATQVGCSVRILTWNDSSQLDRKYDTSIIEVNRNKEK